MHEVATIPCSQTIAEHAQHRGDVWDDIVLMRVTNVVDLVATEPNIIIRVI